MAKKKVLFVCATGIATSTIAEEKVIEYCKEQGIDFDFDQRNVASVPQIAEDFDLIVATTNIPYDVQIPVVNAINLLTGFGMDETLKKIADYLR
ncbi:PTS sugar transporter subunit IIB [Atopobium fossor]|uniref:PTS sugar transporter subunit IIB n=1 Tax=Atopobium fossor TaxID=39487 RepID=UPI000415E35E|nr:PTS sugar transporter subunit IIB [Atopobium fossor]